MGERCQPTKKELNFRDEEDIPGVDHNHFSKSFLNCFKLDIFEERLGKFNTWLNNNMTYVFRSFTENFSNFNLALNNLYMYKSDKKT